MTGFMNSDFLLTSLIVVLLPGTGVMYTVVTALRFGRGASVAAAIGCTLGIVPHLMVVVVGLTAIGQASTTAFEAVRIAGVGWLLWLAWGLWRAPATPALDGDRPDAASVDDGPIRIALRGLLINVLNPKLSAFFLAFLPQFVPPTAPDATARLITLGLVFMAMTLLVFVGYGRVADGMGRRLLSSGERLRWTQRVFALAFAGFALKLLVM